MEKEKIGVGARVKAKGLKNRGLIEITEDEKTGEFVLFMSHGIRRKGPLNLPEEMWRVRCSKDEVAGVVSDYMKEILG